MKFWESEIFERVPKVRYKHLKRWSLAVLECHPCFPSSDHFAGIFERYLYLSMLMPCQLAVVSWLLVCLTLDGANCQLHWNGQVLFGIGAVQAILAKKCITARFAIDQLRCSSPSNHMLLSGINRVSTEWVELTQHRGQLFVSEVQGYHFYIGTVMFLKIKPRKLIMLIKHTSRTQIFRSYLVQIILFR